MAVGDWHELNGYRFQETLFGPLVTRVCVDCARTCYATIAFASPRCEKCLKARIFPTPPTG